LAALVGWSHPVLGWLFDMVNTEYPNDYENQAISEASAAVRTQAEHMQARGSSPAFADAVPSVLTPYCNTGSQILQTPEITRSRPKPASFRFDWYQATLSQEVEPLEVLRWASSLGDPVPGKPVQGYDTCHDFGQLKILYGGHTGQWGVHVIIHGGDVCADICGSFRSHFPEHRPSRIDVCADFQGPGAFDELHGFCKFVCHKYGVQTRLYGDWENKQNGRTYYGGGTGSTHKFRLYEKGHEMRAKGVDPEAPLDWVRLEFQIAPARPSRQIAATLNPDQVARSTKWTNFLCDMIRTTSATPVNLTTKKLKPAAVDSFEHMCAQYASTLFKLNQECWMQKEDVLALVSAMYDKGTFNGLPEHVRRNWYF
jgi:hypothetical protein